MALKATTQIRETLTPLAQGRKGENSEWPDEARGMQTRASAFHRGAYTRLEAFSHRVDAHLVPVFGHPDALPAPASASHPSLCICILFSAAASSFRRRFLLASLSQRPIQTESLRSFHTVILLTLHLISITLFCSVLDGRFVVIPHISQHTFLHTNKCSTSCRLHHHATSFERTVSCSHSNITATPYTTFEFESKVLGAVT